MASTVDLMTLRSMYGPIRENPEEKKAKMLMAVMPESGLAKPLIAAAAGERMASAQEWDEKRESEMQTAQQSGMKLYKQKADQEYFSSAIKNISDIAKNSPGMAKVMFETEAKSGKNPYFNQFKDMNFNSVWANDRMFGVTMANGQIWGLDKADQKIKFWKAGAPDESGQPTGEWIMPTDEDMKATIKGTKETLEPEALRNRNAYYNEYFIKNGIKPEDATFQQKNAADLYANQRINSEASKRAREGRPAAAPRPVTAGLLKSGENELAALWMPHVQNADRLPIDTYTGKPSWAALRSAATPEQRRVMDLQGRGIEEHIAGGMMPKKAAQKALTDYPYERQNPNPSPGAPAANGRKTPLTRENIIDLIKNEIKGRGLE